jgi:hypothetical protein
MNKDFKPKIEQPRYLPDGGDSGPIGFVMIGSFLGSVIYAACDYFNLMDLI